LIDLYNIFVDIYIDIVYSHKGQQTYQNATRFSVTKSIAPMTPSSAGSNISHQSAFINSQNEEDQNQTKDLKM
jgi:hypothetical protein